MLNLLRAALSIVICMLLFLFSGCERFTQKGDDPHAGETAEEHAAHSHEGETPEEHAAHSHEGESAEEHAAHEHHDGETPEEHAQHDHEGEHQDGDGHDHSEDKGGESGK